MYIADCDCCTEGQLLSNEVGLLKNTERKTDWNEGKAFLFSVKGKSRGLVRSVGLFGLKHKEKYYV